MNTHVVLRAVWSSLASYFRVSVVSAGFCQSMARNLTVQEAAAAAAVASM